VLNNNIKSVPANGAGEDVEVVVSVLNSEEQA